MANKIKINKFYYYDQNPFRFSFNFVNPSEQVRFEEKKPQFAQERKTLKDSGCSHGGKMMSSCKWPIRTNTETFQLRRESKLPA